MTARIASIERSPALHLSLVAALKRVILERKLQPGDALPTEAALARQLSVGRNSVREAVKALESLGVVETRRGIGVFVKAFTLEPLFDNLPFVLAGSLREVSEILELRQALEVSLIGKAIDRMSNADIAGIDSLVAAMGAKAERGESFSEEDRAFHKALFRPLENDMLLRMIDTFWEVFYRASGWNQLETRDPIATWRDHVAIVEVVTVRDAELARERLAAHYEGIILRLNPIALGPKQH